MSKITVIGAGNVGATIANDLMIQGIASEIVLIDINRPKAFGEALDIYQGVPYCAPAIVRSGDYPAAADSDIVVITSGMPRKAGQSRLELAQVNVNIMKDIASKIVPVAPNALYVIVSNPVDVLTYVFHKVSGVPENHIIGSGTILDTSRLQAALARRFHISPKNVHAHVYGEHGDSSFVPWSLVHIANNHIDSYRDHSPDKDSIEWNGPAAMDAGGSQISTSPMTARRQSALWRSLAISSSVRWLRILPRTPVRSTSASVDRQTSSTPYSPCISVETVRAVPAVLWRHLHR